MDKYKRAICEAVKKSGAEDPLRFALEAVKPMAIKTLRESILGCDCCPMAKYERKYKSLPRGNENASVLVLCDYPVDAQWDSGKESGYVYEGTEEWGKIIGRILEAFHINEEALFFMNAVNCYPVHCLGGKYVNRLATPEEVENCNIFVDYAFRVVDPIFVLVLGKYAAATIKDDAKFIEDRGKLFTIRGIPAMATYSPSHLVELEGLKDESIVEEYKEDFCEDIRKALLWIQENYPENNVLLEPLED